jgi:hypothetical protein
LSPVRRRGRATGGLQGGRCWQPHIIRPALGHPPATNPLSGNDTALGTLRLPSRAGGPLPPQPAKVAYDPAAGQLRLLFRSCGLHFEYAGSVDPGRVTPPPAGGAGAGGSGGGGARGAVERMAQLLAVAVGAPLLLSAAAAALLLAAPPGQRAGGGTGGCGAWAPARLQARAAAGRAGPHGGGGGGDDDDDDEGAWLAPAPLPPALGGARARSRGSSSHSSHERSGPRRGRRSRDGSTGGGGARSGLDLAARRLKRRSRLRQRQLQHWLEQQQPVVTVPHAPASASARSHGGSGTSASALSAGIPGSPRCQRREPAPPALEPPSPWDEGGDDAAGAAADGGGRALLLALRRAKQLRRQLRHPVYVGRHGAARAAAAYKAGRVEGGPRGLVARSFRFAPVARPPRLTAIDEAASDDSGDGAVTAPLLPLSP